MATILKHDKKQKKDISHDIIHKHLKTCMLYPMQIKQVVELDASEVAPKLYKGRFV